MKELDRIKREQKVIDKAKEILLKHLVDGAHKEQPKRKREDVEKDFIEAMESDGSEVFQAMLTAMKEYAQLVAEASLKEAAENATYTRTPVRDVDLTWSEKITINKSSITNPKNVKLI